VTVADRHSFTVAADELFLTQSAVSQQIRSLETELGVSLFVRGRSNTHLTAAGRSLLPRAQRMIELAGEMKTQFAGGTRVGGKLRIVAATVASSYLYVGLYERFAITHPDIGLDILTGIGPSAIDKVERGEADAVFVQFPAYGPHLDCDVLGESEIVLVGPASTVVPENIRSARLLMWNGSQELQRYLDDQHDLHVMARTNDLALLKHMTDAHLGFAFLPRWSIQSELKAGSFRILESPFPTIRQRFGIAYRHGERSPTLEAFLGAAHDYRREIVELCR
jgi:DNA-binding transcriptional LysR family regulator